jgi:hypothetical protein
MAFFPEHNRRYRRYESVPYPSVYYFSRKEERPIWFIPGRPPQSWPWATLQGLAALTGPARDDSPTTPAHAG